MWTVPDIYTTKILENISPDEPYYKWIELDKVRHYDRDNNCFKYFVVPRPVYISNSKVPKFVDNPEWIKLQKEYENLPEWEEIKKIERKTKSLELLEKSDIWSRFADRRLDNYEELTETHSKLKKLAYDYCNNWPEHSKKWLWLYFSWWVWIWKTHIVCGIIQELIEKYQLQVLYKPTPNLLQEIKATYSYDWSKNSESKILSRCKNAELLVLDDIWTEKPSDRVIEILYTIINDRYENYRPTIFTSNIDVIELWARIWPRIADRIFGMCKVVNLSWITKSYRWIETL